MSQSEHSVTETSRANSQDESGVDRLPHPLSLTHVDETQPRNSANGLEVKLGDAIPREKCVQTPPTAGLEAGQQPQHTRGQFATIELTELTGRAAVAGKILRRRRRRRRLGAPPPPTKKGQRAAADGNKLA